MQDVTIDRWKYIGGSDVPIIMGISPFKTRWQLLREKAQIVEDLFEGNEYTEYGNELEPKIRDYINEEYNFRFKEDKLIQGDLRYHADGYSEAFNTMLEIKTTSTIHENVEEYQVYLVQILLGMLMFGCDYGMLAVYERPDDFDTEFNPLRLHLYDVNMNEHLGLSKRIMEQISLFRDDLNALRLDPTLTEEDLQPVDIVALSTELSLLETQLASMKKIKDQADKLKEDLYTLMFEKGVKSWTTNNGTKLTIVLPGLDTTTYEFDTKRFKQDHPDEYQEYVTPKFKKGKSGYLKVTLPKNE